jgi:predicted Zn-dependent protease
LFLDEENRVISISYLFEDYIEDFEKEKRKRAKKNAKKKIAREKAKKDGQPLPKDPKDMRDSSDLDEDAGRPSEEQIEMMKKMEAELLARKTDPKNPFRKGSLLKNPSEYKAHKALYEKY